MCGITGVYAFNMVGRISMINVANATMALDRRGPDFQDTYHDNIVALGHRRLSIIDTSASGHQPMTDKSGRYIIIFNGEIFNYKTLKEELLNKGIQFSSGSDTEVLLYLYITEGKSCLQKLNGFFAFAIYDKQEQSVFIARDRMGIKPLYYVEDENRVLFASEMKSILAYGIDKTIDYSALYTYLQLNYIPAPKTIFRDVKKLLPGHTLFIKDGEVQKECFYKIPYDKNKYTSLNYDEQKARLSELMEQSVQKRLVADVPVGSFLSGGIDSSVIATLAQRHKPDLHTFSIGYKDEKFFDETEYARLVAKKIGSDHTVFSLTNNDLYQHVNSILNYIDEPFADSSAIAVYILSKETRKHSVVALSGDGADELFSGYNKHSAFLKMITGGSTARAVGALTPLWGLLPKSRSNPLTNKFRQLHRFGKGMKLTSKERYWQWAGFAAETEVDKLLTPESLLNLDRQNYLDFKNNILREIPAKEDINDILYADVNLVLPDDMLTKVDRMSMANSLEVRVPFLDHEVVEFAFSLPVSSKINGQIRKRIVQDSFRDILPAELYNRPKKGFEVPLLKWFRKEMKSMINDDLLRDDFIEQQGIFNVSETKKLKRKLFSSNPGDVHAQIWALIVFQWWWKKYCM
ncbi:asparagine synthase (glutamine-hydrolyzing) [Fulvivirga kasyanovii]|uniref:asparagine synthase (glutamine-hydrolyzing) n=1 Tax=Fulvivirga kasyanovii TaxID=396812 RepID=A0ABW9RJZ3_9BACT|nr:asparagine synthase (glutamine-hydrolyzing) [Fulvivirga kasyanovii]MTI24250.1 asparagine synthase (glutamine-hydrolyzing) [Fulvivirga kasyanovii]